MSSIETCPQCGKLAYPAEMVTIPAEEYRELRAGKAMRDEAQPARLPALRLLSRSRIGRDPEVANFIITSIETMVVKDIVAACREKFGPERTPSKSAVSRFLLRLSRCQIS